MNVIQTLKFIAEISALTSAACEGCPIAKDRLVLLESKLQTIIGVFDGTIEEASESFIVALGT